MYNRNKYTQIIIKNKVWNIETLKDLLKRNNKAVERAILLIYSFQTHEERTYGHTGVKNGKGFNRVDANILSSFAEQLNKGYSLSEKQINIARIRILKYTGQIFNYMLNKKKINTRNK